MALKRIFLDANVPIDVFVQNSDQLSSLIENLICAVDSKDNEAVRIQAISGLDEIIGDNEELGSFSPDMLQKMIELIPFAPETSRITLLLTATSQSRRQITAPYFKKKIQLSP